MTVRRWEVVVGFTAYLLVLGWTLNHMHGSIENAEKRINNNTRAIVSVAARNAAQDEVRVRLLETLREADMRTCLQIEAMKSEFREQAAENFANLERNGELLGIELTPALRQQARIDYEKTLSRFAAREC